MSTSQLDERARTGRIEARGLLVDFRTALGSVRALDCGELSVEPGSSLAIMGPSGCGKSTLLGLLAGLAVPTAGSVTIGDTTVSELSEPERVRFRRRALGMVYQADNLLPHLTVEENVGLQFAISGSTVPPERCAEVLERLGLADLARRLPDELSGGQRQRVAVARAIVHGPTVILADEPTGALDADTAEQAIRLLVEVQRQTSATMVVVTHDPDIAGHLDRTMMLARPAQPTEPSRAR